jgi:hypothetical protein
MMLVVVVSAVGWLRTTAVGGCGVGKRTSWKERGKEERERYMRLGWFDLALRNAVLRTAPKKSQSSRVVQMSV